MCCPVEEDLGKRVGYSHKQERHVDLENTLNECCPWQRPPCLIDATGCEHRQAYVVGGRIEHGSGRLTSGRMMRRQTRDVWRLGWSETGRERGDENEDEDGDGWHRPDGWLPGWHPQAADQLRGR